MKKRDAIRFNIGGIKCDNPKCDYIDQSVELDANINDEEEQGGILTVRMNGTGEVEIESE